MNDVAIVAPYAGAVYEGAPAGGAETQTAFLARALAAAGFSVAHVVRLEREPVDTGEDVSLVPIGAGYDQGGLTRRRALLAALRAADARLYIQRGAAFETGIVGIYARALRRRFVFSASSDANFRTDAETGRLANAYYINDWKSRLEYRVGLRCAHAVVAQTRAQAELARRTYRIDADVVPSFAQPAPRSDERERTGFLWVGRIIGVKDPLAFTELARALPHIPFRMVANDRNPGELGAQLRSAASELPNLELVEPLPRPQLLDLYASAVATVNTSRFEGFSNVFLESWAHATPTLSLNVDVDGAIAERGLGVVAGGSSDVLVSAVRSYDSRPELARAAGEAARRYVEEALAPDVVGAEWARVVERLLPGLS